MSENTKRAVREAIDALPLIDGADADFAEMQILIFLEHAPHFGVDWQPTAKQSAESLDELINALRKLRTAAASIRGPAFEALNAAKHRHELSWPPDGAHWSFLHPGQFADCFDKQWPQLEACAIEAAQELRRSPPTAKPGRPRNSSMEEFAFALACHFHMLTGRPPGTGKGQGPFSKFVEAIFAAGNLDTNANNYADKGARRWHEEKSR